MKVKGGVLNMLLRLERDIRLLAHVDCHDMGEYFSGNVKRNNKSPVMRGFYWLIFKYHVRNLYSYSQTELVPKV